MDSRTVRRADYDRGVASLRVLIDDPLSNHLGMHIPEFLGETASLAPLRTYRICLTRWGR